jgi:transcriptional regulator with XRE-family HTH domain
MSQKTLAARADVNLKHLGQLEHGDHDLLASTFYRLARALDLSYGALAATVDEELAALEERARRRS